MEAHAHAANKDAPACATALNAAERAFAKSQTDTPVWLGYFDVQQVPADEGDIGGVTSVDGNDRESCFVTGIPSG
jgi:hypothetical protein